MKTISALKLSLFSLLLTGLVGLTACQPDEPEETPFDNLTLLSSATEANIGIEVYATETYYAGYNTLYFKVLKDETETKNATVTFTPIMYMTEKTHACPIEQPVLNEDDVFEGHTLFQMPSMNGYWELTVNVVLEDGVSQEFVLPIEVIQPEFARALVTTTEEGKKLIIGYVSPMEPVVGENDFEVAIFTMQDMMNFPAVEGLKVKIEPEMPSMGHGSEGNKNPTEIGAGHYKGTVAFNMVGDWRIHLEVLENDAVLKDGIYFDLFFQ
ncbi:MAG: FixH family protein [Bacteroidia bacterium]